MPWKCPACREQIAHASFEDRPRPEAIYRCHICRLELVFDPNANKLVVIPLEDSEKIRQYR